MFAVAIKKSTANGMEAFGNDVANQIVDLLSSKYNFDPDEARDFLGLEAKKSKAGPKAAPTIPLPFCGVIEESCCQAIVSNKKLFTQCRKSNLPGGNMCKGCCNAANKNGGKPVYGFIQERLSEDYVDKDGKKPKYYGNVMKTLDITREDAEAEAAKFGWTIPEEQFKIIVAKKGRKKGSKNGDTSSESETESTSETDSMSDDASVQPENIVEEDDVEKVEKKQKKVVKDKKENNQSEDEPVEEEEDARTQARRFTSAEWTSHESRVPKLDTEIQREDDPLEEKDDKEPVEVKKKKVVKKNDAAADKKKVRRKVVKKKKEKENKQVVET